MSADKKEIAEASGSAPVGSSSADTDTSSPGASLQYVTIESEPNGDVLLKRSRGVKGGLKIGPGCRFVHFAQNTEQDEDGVGYVRLRRINHLRDTLGLDQGDIAVIRFWVEKFEEEARSDEFYAELEGVGGMRDRVKAYTMADLLLELSNRLHEGAKKGGAVT